MPVDRGDDGSNSTSEEAAPDDPTDQSGHMDSAEIPTAEAFTVTDDSGSSVDAPVLNNDPVTLLTSPASLTLSASSVEVEANSPEIITFIPESNASSEAEPLEDSQDKLEQEGLGESPDVFLNTDQNITEGSERDVTEENSDSGSGESGENPEVKPELFLTNPTLSTDRTVEGIDGERGTDAPLPTDVKITLIPHLTLTSGWEAEPSASTLQESRSDREYSAEPPVTEENDDVSKEQEAVAEITTSSINGEFKVILHQKPCYLFCEGWKLKSF